jgi:HEAT repeat protein
VTAAVRSPSPRARRKEAARELLLAFDLDGVARWAGDEPQAARVLQHLLFDPDELVAWRAVEALGRVAAVMGRADPEPVRELARRTLWLMNDESGGLLWHGPQVLGAVLAHVPALVPDLGEVLASFLEEEPFRAGTRWGLWRLAAAAPGAVRGAAAALAASLSDADAAVRGHAALALRAAGASLPDLGGDAAPFTVFDFRTGALRETTVAAAAAP